MRTERSGLWLGWLQYAAGALLAIALLAGMVASSMLAQFKAGETRETRTAAEQMLGQLQAAVVDGGAASLEGPAVLTPLRNAPHVGTRILVDANGRVIESNIRRDGGQVAGLGTPYVARVLAALPTGTLDPGQRLLIAVSDAVQAEGEHADIYGYTTRLLVDAHGNPVGAVAVGYERNATGPSPLYNGLLLGSLLALVLYWLALPLWVFLDARARGERAWLWAVLALIGNALGVITYVLMRRPSLLACPQCGAPVYRRDDACPRCGLRLRLACPACHEPLADGWKFCPRCASRVAEALSAE